MRVLWGASSQPGSLFPAVPVVIELMRRGHQVTALSDAASEPTFRALGCEFIPERRVDAVPLPAKPMTRETKARWWRDYSLALFADAVDALRSHRFDVVLADPLETGVDFAAEAVGVPFASYVHWGLDECGPDVPFCFHLWDHETPVDIAFSEWWNGLRAEAGLPPETRAPEDHRWYRTSPTLALLLGLPDLVHPQGSLPSGAVRVGPTVWDPPVADPLPEWVSTLGVRRPAVLATVSTVGSPADTAVITHLETATEALGLDLVVTIPIDHQLSSPASHVRICSFVPHGSLLDKAAVFVNHAGNGSVNRAACAGKPALLMPTGRDQFQVAKGATAAGFALTLQPDERDHAHIHSALDRLVNDASLAATAERLAARARMYDAPVTAADLLEAERR